MKYDEREFFCMSEVSNENLSQKGKGKLERLRERLNNLMNRVHFAFLKLRLKLKVGFNKIANFFVRKKEYPEDKSAWDAE